MIETFTLKNFRCFIDTSVSPLSRINLITGKNNCGKTAFLEGLFLHLGATNPELPLNINTFRGIGKLVPNAQEIWGWLFTNKDCQKTITLTSYDSLGKKSDLHIFLEMPEHSVIEQKDETEGEVGERLLPDFMSTKGGQQRLVLHFQGAEDILESKVFAEVTKEQILFTRDKKLTTLPFPPSIFMATKIRHYAEDAERYSRLEEAGLHEEIIEALQEIEPKLKRFVVSIVSGIPSLRADLGGKRTIPISYMGEGMNRLLSLALAIPICQGGVLLIDELENGIYHGALAKVLQSIYKLVKKFNVQLIATTHSWECIRAAHQLHAVNDIYDFRLFEFENIDSQVQIKAYDKDTLNDILRRSSNGGSDDVNNGGSDDVNNDGNDAKIAQTVS